METKPPYPWQVAEPPHGTADPMNLRFDALTIDPIHATPSSPTTKTDESQDLTRGQAEWLQKCASHFSLYAELVGDTGVSDPLEQMEALRRDCLASKAKKDKKPTKSSKKRLKRIAKSKPAQKKRLKKDLKRVINQLSKIPL